ncbi:pollen allergen Phl p 2-like [Panicum miliaceum]|uniref:Pollen allergen Phl p 2-like n=1 Tax=Panicum miliaceum TaxID=4540 RepID=A0A3L6RJW3_PANMI|nr:pollen allergen Phl p 2-like [Panicum miliaceum]
MASRPSSILLAAAALAALVAVGSCLSALSFKIGPGCSATKLVLIPSVAISEVEVKKKGADDFSELKEGPTGTWMLEIHVLYKICNMLPGCYNWYSYR